MLIVNYRAYLEVRSCLQSLGYHEGDSTYQPDDLEVLVVDHGSDPRAASSLRTAFPRVQVFPFAANPGFAVGVNRAARAARGRYLLVLNPDCVLHGKISSLVTWIDSHPTVGVVGPLVKDADGSVQASVRRFPNVTTWFAGRSSWLTRAFPGNRWTRRNVVLHDQAEGPIPVDWVSGACMLIRREAFDAVDGFDERFFLYWEDADFCFRARRAGWATVFHPDVTVTHSAGRSSAKAQARSLIAFHRSAYRYFRKNSGSIAQLAAPAVFAVLAGRLMLKLASLGLGRFSPKPQ